MSRRDSLEAKGKQAEQVLTNPAFDAAFNLQREQFISSLESTPLETPEAEAKALSNVRDLQALLRVKTALVRAVQHGDNYRKAQEVKDVEEPYHPSRVTPTKEN